MNILILAGGVGKRMWPLKTNKLLLPFLGRPLIVEAVASIARMGLFDQIYLVSSPELQKELQRLLAPWVRPENMAIQSRPQGMAGAVMAAAALLKERPTLVVNGDDLCEPSLFTEVVGRIKKGQPRLLIVGREVKTYFPGGYLRVEGNRLLEIVEKPKVGQEPSKLVKLVVDYFQNPQDFVAAIQAGDHDKDDSYETALNHLIRSGIKAEVHRYLGNWVTIKYPWDVLWVMDYCLQTIKESVIDPSVQVDPRANIFGPVVIGKNVKVFSGAVIRGPSWIGENVVVGDNCLVRESMIGPGSVVGFATEVARSWVGEKCWLHSNYVGDSVLEANVAVGAGAVFANLRLDEKEIGGRNKLGGMVGRNGRVGVNAMLMPGVKVGSECFVGPGVILTEDLPDGKFIYVNQSKVIKENRVRLGVGRKVPVFPNGFST